METCTFHKDDSYYDMLGLGTALFTIQSRRKICSLYGIPFHYRSHYDCESWFRRHIVHGKCPEDAKWFAAVADSAKQ